MPQKLGLTLGKGKPSWAALGFKFVFFKTLPCPPMKIAHKRPKNDGFSQFT